MMRRRTKAARTWQQKPPGLLPLLQRQHNTIGLEPCTTRGSKPTEVATVAFLVQDQVAVMEAVAAELTQCRHLKPLLLSLCSLHQRDSRRDPPAKIRRLLVR